MRQVYQVLDKIKDNIDSNKITHTKTFGDFFDIDLDKTTIFPLAHVVVGDVTFSEQVIFMTVDVLFIDVVDTINELQAEDRYYGNTNVQDVLNTQLVAANKLQSVMRRGDLYRDGFQLVSDASAIPFQDRYENMLAGWGLTLQIQIANNDIDAC